MKIPFLSVREKWEPRKRAGLDRKLTAVEREMLDAIDVLDQRSERNESLGVWGCNGVILLCAVEIVTNGPKLLGAVQSWLTK